MSMRYHRSCFHFSLCLLAVAMLSGCASRKIVTAVEDQSFVPGAAPETHAAVAEEAKVSPSTPEPTPAPESAPEPAPSEAPKAEVPAAALTESPKAEAPPAAAPPVEEARITEAPVAPAPTPSPAPETAPPLPAAELADAFFDFDRFTIRSDARAPLEANAGIMKGQPDIKVLIEGHCDERGTSAYNLVLGERRAQAARQYLQDLGVPSSQIQITSYGKERPFCTEHSEACWQSNRRAHFSRR
ncbi:MAG TPA: peptidoglycan-associated lipoprotein Pal [Nitrospira sp.]|nr:peptidoglycan-associated lipoprotein Pal [Nitrospira sp.]